VMAKSGLVLFVAMVALTVESKPPDNKIILLGFILTTNYAKYSEFIE